MESMSINFLSYNKTWVFLMDKFLKRKSLPKVNLVFDRKRSKDADEI